MTRYRIFIGSPSGLSKERKKFRETLQKCSLLHAADKDVEFFPVAWEDTAGGAGRPQEIINEELKQCDYAVFVLHDRWGTPTGNGHSSGTEEEWRLAEELYQAKKIRNIALFFKNVGKGQLRDPGNQLKQVLAFKRKIEEEKRYFADSYSTAEEFSDVLDRHLARWLKDHHGTDSVLASDVASPSTIAKVDDAESAPNYAYWIGEAVKYLDKGNGDPAAALFCANKALELQSSELEWVRAKDAWGRAKLNLGILSEAYSAFDQIVQKYLNIDNFEGRVNLSKALYNKGLTFSSMGRSAEAINIYKQVVSRFGDYDDFALQEVVGASLYGNGTALNAINRFEDEIAIYENMIARFGNSKEPRLQDYAIKALVAKGAAFGQLGRFGEAIRVCDDIVMRFMNIPEAVSQEHAALALVNKSSALIALHRAKEAVSACNDVISRFGTAIEPALCRCVANALFNKGEAWRILNHRREAKASYTELLTRFGEVSDLAMRGIIEEARQRLAKL